MTKRGKIDERIDAALHALQADGAMPPRGFWCELLWDIKATKPRVDELVAQISAISELNSGMCFKQEAISIIRKFFAAEG